MGPDLNAPLNLLLFVGLMLLIGVVAAEIEHRFARRSATVETGASNEPT